VGTATVPTVPGTPEPVGYVSIVLNILAVCTNRYLVQLQLGVRVRSTNRKMQVVTYATTYVDNIFESFGPTHTFPSYRYTTINVDIYNMILLLGNDIFESFHQSDSISTYATATTYVDIVMIYLNRLVQ
jgi:hypothetical protein